MLLNVALLIAVLSGQDLSERPDVCRADAQSPACAAAERLRLQTRYGIAPIEDEAATGAQMFRAVFYNDYGRDRLVVSFESRPEQSPTVVVRGIDGRRAEIPVGATTWNRVVEEAVSADRTLAPMTAPVGADGQINESICMHGWTVALELANAANLRGDRPAVRRAEQNACDDDGLAVDYGFLLAQLAADALPACDQLDPQKHGNSVHLLEACLSLSGNTVAAAGLMNQAGEPPSADFGEAATRTAWRDWLATDGTSRIDWAGDVYVESNVFVSGRPPAPRLADLMVQRAEALKDLRIYQAEVGARDAETGWIRGQIAYRVSSDDEPERLMVADYRQEWSRGGGFGWRMDNWVIGPFQPLE